MDRKNFSGHMKTILLEPLIFSAIFKLQSYSYGAMMKKPK